MDVTIIRDYGWIFAVLLWVLPRAWSFLTDHLFPQVAKEREEALRAREESYRAEREARATLIRAQIDRESRMADQGLDLQRRTVTAIEQMSLGIVAGNERIAALIAAHTQHVNFTFGAHVELKERLDDISEQIVYNKRLDDLEKGLKDTQDKIKAVPKGDKDL
jgi:hypothetical protein